MRIRMIAALAVTVVTTGAAYGSTLPTHDPSWHLTAPNDSSPPTDAVVGNGWVFYAAGMDVYGRYASSGERIAVPYHTGGKIEDPPALVQLRDGRWYVFVTSGDGRLYKFDMQNSISAGAFQVARNGGVLQIRDMRRASSLACAVKDTLTASPLVQLAAKSNGDYSLGKDLVMVPTHHGCGETTTNRIVAVDAADITQPAVWVMNGGGEYSIDYWDSCLLDYTRNRIFCGTNLATGAHQNTMWSIDTVSGSPAWSANVGSVHSRAAFGQYGPTAVDHLYVADATARLHALDPASGSEHWVLDIGGISVTTGVSAGRGAYAGLIIVTTVTGKVAAIFDNGPNPEDGEPLWTSQLGAQRAITRGEIPDTGGAVYVGFDDGSVHQLQLATGRDEGYVTIDNLPPRPPGSVSRVAVSAYRDLMDTKLIVSRSGVGTDPDSVTTQLVVPGPGCVVEHTDIALDETSTLRIEIGGTRVCTEHDRYTVLQALSIGAARLELVLTGGFVPTAGQRFEILQWGSLSGSFDTIDTTQAELGSGLDWDISRLYTTGELVVAAGSPPIAVPTVGSWQLAVLALLLAVLAGLETPRDRS